MSYLQVVELRDSFEPFAAFRRQLGFVPDLFRSQTLLPRVIEAERRIAEAILFETGTLARLQMETILFMVAAAKRNEYCVTAHGRILISLGLNEDRQNSILNDHRLAGLTGGEIALVDFALKLSRHPTWMGPLDIEELQGCGFSDKQILEAVLVTSLGQFLCTLAVGLGAKPDLQPRPMPSMFALDHPLREGRATGDPGSTKQTPYLETNDLNPETFPPFAFFKERFGFIPNIFRAQTLKPEAVDAEAKMIEAVLLSDDVLPRVIKEYILLVVSSSNLNTYCVAVHSELLRMLGIPEAEVAQIAVDHRLSDLSDAEKALLDFALKLNDRPGDISSADIDTLRALGFGDAQILESIVMTSLSSFLNTLQMGLGAVPDFAPDRVFSPESCRPADGIPTGMAYKADPFGAVANLTGEPQCAAVEAGTEADGDFRLVVRVQSGDLSAFETLIQRNGRRVYRAALGLSGNTADAEDAMQSAFLKAFQHIGEFQGRSSFATWLIRIAINETLLLLRGRKNFESLEENEPEEVEGFRPRVVTVWNENPELLYSRAQVRSLVERELLKLPVKYRLAVILRDLEQFSTEEAAAALGLRVATLKSRLLRGRLMLREAITPYFARKGRVKSADL